MIEYVIVTIFTMFLCLVIVEVFGDTNKFGKDDWILAIIVCALVGLVWVASLPLITLVAIGFGLKRLARPIGRKIRGMLK